MNKMIYVIIAVALSFCANTYSQNESAVDSLVLNKKMAMGWAYLHGKGKPYMPEKAFEIFLECANNGSPAAMNAAGKMYMDGLGVDADVETAVKWFNKAAENNYLIAWINLGNAYKNGQCVGQDYDMAYHCYKMAADHGNKSAIFHQAYMLYKGFGCRQDYGAAYNLFSKGAAMGNASCMYYQGLCLRNGYGVGKSDEQAKFWLDESAKGGCTQAMEELDMIGPESGVNSGALKSARENKTCPTVAGSGCTLEDLNGSFQGYLLHYDWSGTNILKKSTLRLDLLTEGNVVTGTWTESDSLVSDVCAFMADSLLVFSDVELTRTGHYNSNRPIGWSLKDANLKIALQDSVMQICGDIRTYSNSFNEPGKPMRVFLYRNIEPVSKSVKEEADINVENQSNLVGLMVNPNPFGEELDLFYRLKKDCKIRLELISIDGKIIVSKNMGVRTQGEYHEKLSLSLSPGSYTLNVYCDKNKHALTVIKK